ncbi:MAG: AbrB family transcriptional regulator [Clostridia bacterium]|jgi:membrane AbrB-like protein|nr:AbrB family transcriptional regulator [Clostridia bacterium]MDF2891456.1 AbrB family transcriptional regulator [Clostridia bacterium]
MTKKWFVCLSAVLGGLLFNYLRIPAGAMVGSLLGTAASQMVMDIRLDISPIIKRSTRMILGCYIGLGITIEGIQQFKNILGAVAIGIIGIMLVTLLTTSILYKFYQFNLMQAFLSSLPAGLSEIGMNAEEFKVDPLQLTTIHLMRLISTLVLIPLLVSYFK